MTNNFSSFYKRLITNMNQPHQTQIREFLSIFGSLDQQLFMIKSDFVLKSSMRNGILDQKQLLESTNQDIENVETLIENTVRTRLRVYYRAIETRFVKFNKYKTSVASSFHKHDARYAKSATDVGTLRVFFWGIFVTVAIIA